MFINPFFFRATRGELQIKFTCICTRTSPTSPGVLLYEGFWRKPKTQVAIAVSTYFKWFWEGSSFFGLYLLHTLSASREPSPSLLTRRFATTIFERNNTETMLWRIVPSDTALSSLKKSEQRQGQTLKCPFSEDLCFRQLNVIFGFYGVEGKLFSFLSAMF